MIQDNVHVLEYRINYLMDGMYRKKTSKILMIAVLALPLLTNKALFWNLHLILQTTRICMINQI